MSLVQTTSHVAPAARFDYWRTLISRSFVSLDVIPAVSIPRLSGKVAGVESGDVRVTKVKVEADPHSVVRTTEAINREPDRGFLLSMQTANVGLVNQSERSATLHPGDFALYDSAREYELTFPEGNHGQIVVQLPRAVTETRIPFARDVTATRIPGDTGLGSCIAVILNRLDEVLPATTPTLGAHVLDTTLDLIAGLFDDSPIRQENMHLARARAFIDKHADDPSLTPSRVAAEINVSIGYLHRIFASSGETIGQSINRIRLERCVMELSDPKVSHLTIADIAHRHGFTDAAHFSRSFKRYKGVSPREWRTERT